MSLGFLKNKYFLILIAILLVGGVFYWQNQKPTPPEEWDTAEVSQREDYKIIEQDDGLLVKNEKAGLSFELPEGWEFEEEFSKSSESGGVSFASPDMVTATRTSIVAEGCRLKVGVTRINTDISTLKEEIPERFSYYGVELQKQELVKIADYKATKHIFKDPGNEMYYNGFNIPVQNRLYELILDTAIQDQERCSQEFDKISDTVSIK